MTTKTEEKKNKADEADVKKSVNGTIAEAISGEHGSRIRVQFDAAALSDVRKMKSPLATVEAKREGEGEKVKVSRFTFAAKVDELTEEERKGVPDGCEWFVCDELHRVKGELAGKQVTFAEKGA